MRIYACLLFIGFVLAGSYAIDLVAVTSQCDVVQTASFSVKAGTRTVSTWWRAKNSDGTSATLVGWKAAVDSTLVAIPMKQATAPDTTGCAQYSGVLAFSKGTHTFNLQACAADGVGGTACASSARVKVTAK